MRTRSAASALSFLFALALLAPSASSRSHELEGLGTLFPYLASAAEDVSDDGRVIVGSSFDTTGQRATMWLERDPLGEFSTLDLGTLPDGGDSRAYAVSADGTVAVGYAADAAERLHAFRWTQEGGLEDLREFSIGRDVSADGSVVVGSFQGGTGTTEAFAWSRSAGMVGLGFLDGHDTSVARGVSDDGTVIVGWSRVEGDSASGRAFRWVAGEGMQDLGTLPFAGSWSHAGGVSGDGAVVVGDSVGESGTEAFRWTESEGMVALGFLGGISEATATNVDGTIVTGNAVVSSYATAFRWEADTGMTEVGVLNCGGRGLFASSEGTAISRDGRWIVGAGDGTIGSEAMRARLTRPCASDSGDLAPGFLDESTDPPTWRAEGDGRVDVGDVIVLLRSAAGFHVVDCEP